MCLLNVQRGRYIYTCTYAYTHICQGYSVSCCLWGHTRKINVEHTLLSAASASKHSGFIARNTVAIFTAIEPYKDN